MRLTTVIAGIALASFVGSTAAPAATGDTYKVKKAECKKRADKMNFGIHLIKNFATSLHYDRTPAGNRVVLEFVG